MHTRPYVAAGALAAVILLAGCSTSTVDGAPATPAAATDDVAVNEAAYPVAPGAIDPGAFPTTPQAEFGTVATESRGIIVEGQRMAEFVVLPTELDPQLLQGAAMSTYVIKDGLALANLLPGRQPQIAQDAGMIVGFSTSRSYPDRDAGKSIVHTVLRFPDAAAAARAAQEMSVAGQEPVEGIGPSAPSNIDALPDTAVTVRETAESFSSEAYTARGDFVIYTWAETPTTDKDWAAQITAKAVDQQGPMIDRFPITPVGDIAALPMDIDKVLTLTIPAEDGRWASDLAVYGPRGAAHFSSNPVTNLDAMDEAGADRLATDDTSVYRAGDAAGAEKLHSLFAEEIVNDQGFIPAASPPGVPGASCFLYETARGDYTYCLVHRGRYLGEISDLDDEAGVHQKTAAQYLILDSVA